MAQGMRCGEFVNASRRNGALYALAPLLVDMMAPVSPVRGSTDRLAAEIHTAKRMRVQPTGTLSASAFEQPYTPAATGQVILVSGILRAQSGLSAGR